jgi:signal peptidase
VAGRAPLRARFISWLLLFIGASVLVVGIAARVADVHVQTVVSNSMQPTFSAGDLVVTEPVFVSLVQVGDVIAFVPPQGGRPVIHRVTSIENGVVTTRGDANPVDDPWHATLAGTTTYRLIAVVPFLGWVTELQLPILLLAGLLGGLALLRSLGRGVIAKRRIRSRTQPQT